MRTICLTFSGTSVSTENEWKSVRKIDELERDLAAKANAARDMQEDINSRQLALDDLAAKNDSLSGSNAKLRDKKKQCVDELAPGKLPR